MISEAISSTRKVCAVNFLQLFFFFFEENYDPGPADMARTEKLLLSIKKKTSSNHEVVASKFNLEELI